MEMNKAHLQVQKRRWLPRRQVLWAAGAIAVLALCTLLVLLDLSLTYRQARIEQEVVSGLLSTSPQGCADRDTVPIWRGRLCDLFGIPRPVTDLFLKGNQVSDDGLAKLESLQALTSLSLDQCRVSDEGVKHIAKLARLEYLTLFYCDGITDASLTDLAAIRSLTNLNISSDSDQVSGRNIHCLSRLPSLGTLGLNGCIGISDDAVESLASLDRLANLDIRGTSISKKGVNALQRALPGTIILADY